MHKNFFGLFLDDGVGGYYLDIAFLDPSIVLDSGSKGLGLPEKPKEVVYRFIKVGQPIYNQYLENFIRETPDSGYIFLEYNRCIVFKNDQGEELSFLKLDEHLLQLTGIEIDFEMEYRFTFDLPFGLKKYKSNDKRGFWFDLTDINVFESLQQLIKRLFTLQQITANKLRAENIFCGLPDLPFCLYHDGRIMHEYPGVITSNQNSAIRWSHFMLTAPYDVLRIINGVCCNNDSEAELSRFRLEYIKEMVIQLSPGVRLCKDNNFVYLQKPRFQQQVVL